MVYSPSLSFPPKRPLEAAFFLYCLFGLELPGDVPVQFIVAGIQEVIRRPPCKVGALIKGRHGFEDIVAVSLRYKRKNIMDCAVVNPENVTHQIDLRGLGTTDGHQNIVSQVVGYFTQFSKSTIVQNHKVSNHKCLLQNIKGSTIRRT